MNFLTEIQSNDSESSLVVIMLLKVAPSLFIPALLDYILITTTENTKQI